MFLDFLFQIWRRLSGYLQWWSLWLFNSKFMMCVSGVVFDEFDRVLLQRHRHWVPEVWGLPGGIVKSGESLEEAFAREVLEETNLKISDIETIRLVSNYRLRIEVYFRARLSLEESLQELKIQEREILEAKFFRLDELPSNIIPLQRGMIESAKRGRSPNMSENSLLVQRSILSATSLLAWMLQHYDLSTPVTCEFWNHSINDTYLVQAGTSKFMLRVSPTSWRTIEQINAELDLLKFLHQQRLSVPQPLPQKDGTFIQTLNAPEGPRHAVLFTFVPGTPTEMTEVTSRQYGQAVAQFHTSTDGYPMDRAGLFFEFEDMTDKPLALLKPLFAEHQDEYEYLMKVALKIKPSVENLPKTAPIFGVCHGDLNAGNFHIHEDGGWSLVDFEYFGYGWRIFDIATFFNTQLVDRGQTDQTKRVLDSFMAGYQTVRKLAAAELEALSAFVILRQIWLLGTSARYIPKSTVGVQMHRQWIFQQVMPFIREWIDDPWRF